MIDALRTPVAIPLAVPHPPGLLARTKRWSLHTGHRLLVIAARAAWRWHRSQDNSPFSATSDSRWRAAPMGSGDTQPATPANAGNASVHDATPPAATTTTTTTTGGEPPYAQQIRAQVDSLYTRHARAVLGYLCQRLPHQADAEDALAEVFSAALQVCARGQAPDLPWLLTVARRRAADFYRSRQRRGGMPVERGLDAADALAWPADLQDDPEWRALHAEEARELAELIARLPADQREAIALRFAAGLPSAQIAVALGKSDEATRALLSRAMRRLREEWRR